MADPRQSSLRSLLGQAIWANWRIALIIGSLAGGLIAGYYYIPAVRAILEPAARLKERYGFFFAIVSTACFGGILPLLIEQLRARPGRRLNGMNILFMLAFWGYKGVELDLLYRGQAWLFGDDPRPGTVLLKTLVDMLLYAPLWAIPSLVFAYAWLGNRLAWRRTMDAFSGDWVRRRILPVLVVNWIIWVPSVWLIYSLPLPLQLPVQNIILLLFAIVLLFLSEPVAGMKPAAGTRLAGEPIRSPSSLHS